MDFPSADSYGTPRQNPTSTPTNPYTVPEVEVLEAESTQNDDDSPLVHFCVGALVGAFAATFFGAMRR